MLRRILVAVAALVVVVVAAAPAASAAPSSRWVSLYNYGSRRCLDVDPATWLGNGAVRAWDCNGTAQQAWLGNWDFGSATQIQAGAPGPTRKCLTAVPANWIPSGWIVETRNCGSGDYHQLWYVQRNAQLYN